MSGVSFDDLTVTYNGNKQYLNFGGSLPMNVYLTGYVYVDENGDPCDGTYAINAGTYTVTVSFGALDTDNYNAISDMKAVLVINKAEAEVDVSGMYSTSYTYNGEEQTVTGAAIVKADDGATIIYKNNTFTGVPVGGVLTVEITVEDGTNYKTFTTTVDITINKAILTITAENHTIMYGDEPANNGVSHSGFVNEEDEELLNSLNYVYNYSQYGNVGDYVISVGGITSNNYEIKFVDGKLTVEKYEVTVNWNSGNYNYDGKEHKPTAAFTDLFGTEVGLTVVVTNTNGGLVNQVISAGDYVATASTSNPNYTLTGGICKFTIIADTDNWIRFDFRKDYVATYGSVPETEEELAALAEELINYSYVRVYYNTNGEINDLDAVIKLITVRLEINGETLVTKNTPVGRYNICFEFKSEYADNYSTYKIYQTSEDSESTNLGRFVIEQRKLTLNWGNTEFKYDGEAHLLKITVKGFIDGATPVSFTIAEDGGEFDFDIDGTTVKFTVHVNSDIKSVGGHTVSITVDDENYAITNSFVTVSIKEAGGLSASSKWLIGLAVVLAAIAIIAIVVAAKRKRVPVAYGNSEDDAVKPAYDEGGFEEPFYE